MDLRRRGLLRHGRLLRLGGLLDLGLLLRLGGFLDLRGFLLGLGRRLRPLKAGLPDPKLVDEQPVLGVVLVVLHPARQEVDPGWVEQRHP